jgi:acyl CoA:acetate/3-ketoacid CoA transferase alpha subunit
VARIKAHRADRSGNLVFRKSAQNFNPLMAMACDYVIVEAEHVEDVGVIDPDHVMLPGIFVDAVVKGV